MKSKDGRFEYTDMNGKPAYSANEVAHFRFGCRGNDGQCTVRVGLNMKPPGKSTWQWDGNVDHPTLAPSINCKGCWHGFIIGGVYYNTSKALEQKQ